MFIDNKRYYLWAWPLYYVYIIVKTTTNGHFYDDELSDVIKIQLLLSLAMLAIWVSAKYSLRNSQFKFSLMLPSLILINEAAAVGVFFDNSNLMKSEYLKTLANPWSFLITGYLEIFIIPVVIGIGIFKYMLNLGTPFADTLIGVSNEVKKGNYNVQIEDTDMLSDSVFGPLALFVNDLISQTQISIHEIHQLSNYIKSTSELLATGSMQANSSSEEVVSTSQYMSKGAAEQAEMVNEIVIQLNDANKVVENIIEQINENTKAVSQISLQTNILALNAGIEASRAGDYGRGFAVVAENVRRLSEEAKILTVEITEVVTKISTTLQKLFGQITNRIENVAAVSQETSASAEEVTAASEDTKRVIEEISVLASQLLTKANDLQDFTVEVLQ